MNFYSAYVTSIIIIKTLFFILSMFHLYLQASGSINYHLDENILYWRSKLEFSFKFLMALLLIYLFNSKKPVLIFGETKDVLYVFGFLLLITANWNDFIKEANWFKLFQYTLY
jgi:hypothetical protein